MAMRWIKLTEHGSNGVIHINLEQASSIQKLKGEDCTTIYFMAGQKEGEVKVMQTAKEIFDCLAIKLD